MLEKIFFFYLTDFRESKKLCQIIFISQTTNALMLR